MNRAEREALANLYEKLLHGIALQTKTQCAPIVTALREPTIADLREALAEVQCLDGSIPVASICADGSGHLKVGHDYVVEWRPTEPNFINKIREYAAKLRAEREITPLKDLETVRNPYQCTITDYYAAVARLCALLEGQKYEEQK